MIDGGELDRVLEIHLLLSIHGELVTGSPVDTKILGCSGPLYKIV